MDSRYRVQVRGERRATESELHKKGYKTMAMNASEPEPCEPLACDAASRCQCQAHCSPLGGQIKFM